MKVRRPYKPGRFLLTIVVGFLFLLTAPSLGFLWHVPNLRCMFSGVRVCETTFLRTQRKDQTSYKSSICVQILFVLWSTSRKSIGLRGFAGSTKNTWNPFRVPLVAKPSSRCPDSSSSPWASMLRCTEGAWGKGALISSYFFGSGIGDRGGHDLGGLRPVPFFGRRKTRWAKNDPDRRCWTNHLPKNQGPGLFPFGGLRGQQPEGLTQTTVYVGAPSFCQPQAHVATSMLPFGLIYAPQLRIAAPGLQTQREADEQCLMEYPTIKHQPVEKPAT